MSEPQTCCDPDDPRDCHERAYCEEAGEPGHSACGFCLDHMQARHRCGCTGVRDLSRFVVVHERVAAFSAFHPPSYPTTHHVQRDGNRLICASCAVSIEAPTLPRPPLSPMEASLSRFD